MDVKPNIDWSAVKDAEARAQKIRDLRVRLTHHQSVADDARNAAESIKTMLAALLSKYQVGDRVRVERTRWLYMPRPARTEHYVEIWEITGVVYEDWRAKGYRLIGLKVRRDSLLWNRAPMQIYEDDYGMKILGLADGATARKFPSE